MHKCLCIPSKELRDTSLSSFSVGIALSGILLDLAFVYETKDKHFCIKIMKSCITELKRNEANNSSRGTLENFPPLTLSFLVALFFLSKHILA